MADKIQIDIEALTRNVNEIDKFAQSLNDLGGDAKALQGKAAALAEQLHKVENAQGLVAEFEAASAALVKVAGQANKAATELEALQRESATAAGEQARLQSNLEASRTALDTARAATSSLNAEITRNALVVKDDEARLKGLGDAAKVAAGSQTELNKQVRAANTDLSQAEKAVDANDKALRRNQATIVSLEATLAKARDTQRSLSNQVIAADAPTAALTERQVKATEKVASLGHALEQARARQSDLNTQLTGSSAALAGAQQRYVETAAAAGAAAKTTADLNAQVSASRAAVDQQKTALAGQKAQLDEATKSEKAFEQAVRQDEKALRDKSARVADLQQRTDKAAASQAEYRARVVQATDSVRAIDGELRKLGVDTNNLADSQKKLVATADAAEAELKGLGKAAEELRAKVAKRDLTAERALLGLVPHTEIRQRIVEVQKAFDDLKRSGTLSQTELAQAALRTQEKIRELEVSTNGWVESLQKAKLGLGAVAAAGAGLGGIVKQAVDFETAMAQVSKVVDATPEQLATLTARIKDLSTELPISADGLAAIAAAGGQLGIAAEDLEEFINLASKISVGFGISADQAGLAVAKLKNVFSLTLPEIGKLADGINLLGNTTAATESQITEFLVRVGGSAKTFGLTAEAAAALGASLISVGKAPEVAANAINALLTRLQAATTLSPKAQGALEAIGFSAEELAQRVQANPQKALSEFLKTLEQLDGRARAEAIAEILGVEYNDDINLLVNSLGQYQQALAAVSDEQKTAGALQKEVDRQNATTEAQLTRLLNTLETMAIDIGTAVLPALVSLTAGVQTVAEAFRAVTEAQPGLVALVGTAAALAPVLGTLKLAATAVRVAFATGLDSTRALAGGLVGLHGNARTAAAGLDVAAVSSNRYAAAARNTAVAVDTAARAVPLLSAALRGTSYLLIADQLGRLVQAHLEYREAAESAAAAQQKANADLRQGIAQAADQAAKVAAQGAATQVALDAVSSGMSELTASQRLHYANILSGAEQYLKAQIAIGVRERELYGQTQIDLAAVRQKLQEVRAAQGELQQGIDSAKPIRADQVIDPALLPKLREVRDDLRKVGDEDLAGIAMRAQSAFGAVQAEIDKVAAQFPALKGAGLEAALALDSRYSALIQTKRELATTIEGLRDEQFRRLGVDAGEVLTGIDSKAKGLIATFTSLASDPATDPRILTAAFQGLFKVLDSPEELEALKASLGGVQAKGFDAAKAVGEIEQKLKDVRLAGDKELAAVEAAFQKLGITSSAVLQRQADEARAAYEVIRSGSKDIGDVEQALLKVAEAELKAAAAAGEYQVKNHAAMLLAQASTEEQRKKVQELIDKYIEKGQVAEEAGKKAVDASRQTQDELEKEKRALDRLNEGPSSAAIRDQQQQDEARRNKPTSVVINPRNYDPRYNQLTPQQREEIDRIFDAQISQVISEAQRTSGTGLQNIADLQLGDQIRRRIDTLLSPGNKPAGDGRPSAEPVRTVRIELPNGQRINVLPGEERTLESFIRQLAASRSVST